jgi:hypothetical protein
MITLTNIVVKPSVYSSQLLPFQYCYISHSRKKQVTTKGDADNLNPQRQHLLLKIVSLTLTISENVVTSGGMNNS